MNLIIETEDLGKHYGDVRAVEHLSLRVAEGEIYAREPWASVGYLVEIPHSYPELTVYENLEVARRLHPGTPKEAVSGIIERMGLAAYADRWTGNLSQGNAQRLGLAKALLHRPKLLFLDEPANGLDPAGIVEIRELLLELTREQGVTVFMSSHILAEVSRLAQRIGIIHTGRLLQEMNILKDMLAVPVPRSSILLAKFIVVATWSAALTIVIFIVGLVMGAIIQLPGGSISIILQGSILVAITACLVITAIVPFALFASVGRGYLLPMGVAFLAAIMTNLVVVAGWGEYFPWAVPALYAQGKSVLTPLSYWIVFVTGLAGMLATYLWWKYADQNR